MRRTLLRILCAASCIVAGTACNGDAFTDAQGNQSLPEHTYWALRATYGAVNLALVAPYNTVQLDAVPYNANGVELDIADGKIKYFVADTAKIEVTPDGLLLAKQTGRNIVVVASLQINAITHIDTIWVSVTATTPAAPLGTFSVHPVAPDSARWSVGYIGDRAITAVAKTINNQSILNLQVRYSTSASYIARVSFDGTANPTLIAYEPGKVWVYATTYAYGVFAKDSVEFTITPPAYQTVVVDRVMLANGQTSVMFYPSTITIGAGGIVAFIFYDQSQWDGVQAPGISFDDPSQAKAPTFCLFATGPMCQDALFYDLFLIDAREGNSTPRPIWTSSIGIFPTVMRTWSEPGTYTFKDSWGMTSGKIIVLGRDTPE